MGSGHSRRSAQEQRPAAPVERDVVAGSSALAARGDIDIHSGCHTVKLAPTDNVYSFFMFYVPLAEAAAPGRLTWSKTLAYGLVLTTILLQTILLYAIFNEVVSGDITWRESIMGPSAFLQGPVARDVCNPGGSLCTKSGDRFTCAPPSVQLTGRWDELDLNRDGVWTRQEAEESRERLRCKYIVDPVEVFDVFVAFLHSRGDILWLHPGLVAGTEIRKVYFTYASGDLIMCGYRNTDMCANLLLAGVFDVPLKYSTAPRVGNSTESALAYCYALLGKGGMCERTLPSTYSVWKKSSERQCLGPRYSQAVYKHPASGRPKSLLVVDYKARKDYEMVDRSMLFFTYKAIIIGSFLLEMYRELKNVLVQMAWVALFPSADGFHGAAVVDGQTVESGKQAEISEPGKSRILGISKKHRFVVGCLTIARLAVLAVLTLVGITFLQKDTDWVNLLLNSVALVFVAELATSLYAQVLSPLLREKSEDLEPMEVHIPRLGWLHARPGAGDVVGFLLLVLTLLAVMYGHYNFVGHPLSEALECACLSHGEHCSEAQRFSEGFWDHYWKDQVPSVFAEVEQLRQQTTGHPLRRHRPSKSKKRMLNP